LTDCIFCKIAAGAIPTEFLYQDEEIIAFRDIHPLAPVHILILPKNHIPSLIDLKPQHRELIGKLVEVANGLARSQNIAEKGYRLVINCGPDGGQVVPHLHLHLLGGRRMSDKLR
jgi:histidine triad (HIT) family protein